MHTIKDRNSMDLTESGNNKKRQKKCTVELDKNVLMTQIATMV